MTIQKIEGEFSELILRHQGEEEVILARKPVASCHRVRYVEIGNSMQSVLRVCTYWCNEAMHSSSALSAALQVFIA